MMYTVEKLRKMRAAAREKILAENPELKAAWENRSEIKHQTVEEVRRQDTMYLKEGDM